MTALEDGQVVPDVVAAAAEFHVAIERAIYALHPMSTRLDDVLAERDRAIARVADLEDELGLAKRCEVILADQLDAAVTLGRLQRVSVERCARWHGPETESWSTADWSNATFGELGEAVEALLLLLAAAGKAGNLVKKIRRHETGTGSADLPDLDKLRGDLGEELADVQSYLPLLAHFCGIDLEAATVAKFDAVSEREGFPERLGEQTPPAIAELVPEPEPESPSFLCTHCDPARTFPSVNGLKIHIGRTHKAAPFPPAPEPARLKCPHCEHPAFRSATAHGLQVHIARMHPSSPEPEPLQDEREPEPEPKPKPANASLASYVPPAAVPHPLDSNTPCVCAHIARRHDDDGAGICRLCDDCSGFRPAAAL